MDKLRSKMKGVTNQLTLAWILISIWGILNIYSTTYNDVIKYNILPITIIVSILMFIIMFFVLYFMRKNYNKIYKLVTSNINLIYFIALAMLVLVFVIGAARGGARSVISLGIVDFQPLELVKIAIILFLANAFANLGVRFMWFKVGNLTKSNNLIKLALFMLIPVFLILIEPDLGGAIIVFLVIYVMFCIHGSYSKFILKVSGVVLLLGIAGIFLLDIMPSVLPEYQIDRITTWLEPFGDTHGASWDIRSALIGISNGNLFGEGFLKGAQKTFIAARSTDYIFVTICEEWGIFGATLTIGLQLFIISCCIRIGNYAHRRFGMLYCYGFGFLLLIQVVVNICGVTNVIPMTGVTLPFISNGINSYMFLSLGLFFCIVIERRSNAFYRKQDLDNWANI